MLGAYFGLHRSDNRDEQTLQRIIIMSTEKRNHETSKVMRGMRELGIDVRAVNVNNGTTRNCNRIRYNGRDWTWGAFHKTFVAR